MPWPLPCQPTPIKVPSELLKDGAPTIKKKESCSFHKPNLGFQGSSFLKLFLKIVLKDHFCPGEHYFLQESQQQTQHAPGYKAEGPEIKIMPLGMPATDHFSIHLGILRE